MDGIEWSDRFCMSVHRVICCIHDWFEIEIRSFYSLTGLSCHLHKYQPTKSTKCTCIETAFTKLADQIAKQVVEAMCHKVRLVKLFENDLSVISILHVLQTWIWKVGVGGGMAIWDRFKYKKETSKLINHIRISGIDRPSSVIQS